MNRISLLGVVTAGLLGWMGYNGMAELRQKAAQQAAATDVVQRWKHSYQALAQSTSAWSTRYPDLSRFNDLLGLFRSVGLERYGLSSDPDQLAIIKVERVAYNEVQLGLTRVCFASGNASADAGLQVSAPSYAALLAGVRDLAARKDVEIGSLVVLGGGEGATATLGGFCVLLRQEASA